MGGWLGSSGEVGSEVRRLGPCLPPTGPGQPWVAQASGFTSGKGVCFPGQRYQGGERSSIPANGNKSGSMKWLRLDIAKIPSSSSLLPTANSFCSCPETARPAGGPRPQVTARVISRSPPARSDSPASSRGECGRAPGPGVNAWEAI